MVIKKAPSHLTAPHRRGEKAATALALAKMKANKLERANKVTVMSPVRDGILLESPLGANVDSALTGLTSRLGENPLSGKRFAVVTGHDFIPSEMREYAYMLRKLGGQVQFVTDGPKTVKSDLNGGTSIQQLEVGTDIRQVRENLKDYAGVIVAANYTSKNQSGGKLAENQLFKLVDEVLQRGDIALGLNCHALWGLMGAKAITATPEKYSDLNLTFNTVLEPEARALGIKDARPANVDMHDFAVTDSKRHIVSSSAGVGNGTVRLVEQMAEEVVKVRGGADFNPSAKRAASPLLPPVDPKGIPQRLGTIGFEERTLQKLPAIDDPRHFDVPVDSAAVDSVVQSIRSARGSDQPLAGKKVAVVVESLFDPAELKSYGQVLGELGADVVYTSRLKFPGWDETNKDWKEENTFQSLPGTDKLHQLRVTTDLGRVEANIGEYAAVVLPDGDSLKRLSYRPDGQAYEENPAFKTISAALKSPNTLVAVSGRGLWGMLGAVTLPDGGGLKGTRPVVFPAEEMTPEALGIINAVGGRVGHPLNQHPIDTANGIFFNPNRQPLSMVGDLAWDLAFSSPKSNVAVNPEAWLSSRSAEHREQLQRASQIVSDPQHRVWTGMNAAFGESDKPLLPKLQASAKDLVAEAQRIAGKSTSDAASFEKLAAAATAFTAVVNELRESLLIPDRSRDPVGASRQVEALADLLSAWSPTN